MIDSKVIGLYAEYGAVGIIVVLFAMMIESIIIAFSIRDDMFLSVAIGALVIIGLRLTKKVLGD